MRTVPVRMIGTVSPFAAAQAAEVFAATFTLTDLLRWANAQQPVVSVVDIVTQDEFTHDVVLPVGLTFLSFDTT